MRLSRLPSIVVLIATFFVCFTAVATDSAQARPLKDVIRLGTGPQRGVSGRRILPQVSFDKLNQKFTEFSGNASAYESGAKAMPEIAKQCAAKSYSVQDQMAADCTGNDTLNQCMDKLYKHCIETYSFGGFSLPTGGISPISGDTGGGTGGGQMPPFSTKQFQQSAKTAAAQARALSQLLTQYANEVDQNAKAMVP